MGMGLFLIRNPCQLVIIIIIVLLIKKWRSATMTHMY
jgi:hypothetical protein